MAKPDKMPQQAIIDGMKGLIDYYYWKGVAVARRWPRYFARTPSPQEAVNQADFAYINKLYSTLPAIVLQGLIDHAKGTTQVPKDYLVRAYLKGLFELMPPEYYATEDTLLLVLAQLDVALSTRALEAGGNLAAILAQLDVALSTRALEAGGNLADAATRLSTILTNLLTENRTWGYMDTYAEIEEDLTLPAGNVWLSASTVPANEIWNITGATMRYVGTPPSYITLAALIGGISTDIYIVTPPVSGQTYTWNGHFTIKNPGYVFFFIAGATLNDDFTGRVWGTKMKTNL